MTFDLTALNVKFLPFWFSYVSYLKWGFVLKSSKTLTTTLKSLEIQSHVICVSNIPWFGARFLGVCNAFSCIILPKCNDHCWHPIYLWNLYIHIYVIFFIHSRITFAFLLPLLLVAPFGIYTFVQFGLLGINHIVEEEKKMENSTDESTLEGSVWLNFENQNT